MTSYNEWLKDYLMQGGAPTHVYEGLGLKISSASKATRIW